MTTGASPAVLVRGVGEIGSAIAHALARRGRAVAIQEARMPMTARRGMAFADAVFDGSAWLEGVEARRIDAPDAAARAIGRGFVPVIAAPVETVVALLPWAVLVDARMAKREAPDRAIGLAPLTVGLGPGHKAGATADWVVETAWGPDMGRVMTSGATLPLSGEPRQVGGAGRERFVYAPAGGVFRTAARIGEMVAAGATIAEIGGIPLRAPLDGSLRGLVRDGVPVPAGTKVIEVDPRGAAGQVSGLGERPRHIGERVAEAVGRHLDGLGDL
ncbi:xanthine dehydrogenase [Arenibaculum pallidiluteum]|uniref:xanthine dehydrogenase n=1 Tax=Arenibaculum pallidiluteum TaxID=2812559 RepID=UPI002E2AF291|nr:xanthine dehydrogenase [Arenibaculum pallidiluteum]